MHFFSKENTSRERERERDNFTIKQEFVQKFLHNFLSHSPQFGEIVFWCVWRENSWAPPKFPPPLPLNQTLVPTIFCPIFSHFFSLLPISPPTKHTIKVSNDRCKEQLAFPTIKRERERERSHKTTTSGQLRERDREKREKAWVKMEAS